jgi:hypothetical protein
MPPVSLSRYRGRCCVRLPPTIRKYNPRLNNVLPAQDCAFPSHPIPVTRVAALMAASSKCLFSLSRRRRPNHISYRHERCKHHLNKPYDCACMPANHTVVSDNESIKKMANQQERRCQPIQGVHGNQRVKHPSDQRTSSVCRSFVQRRLECS